MLHFSAVYRICSDIIYFFFFIVQVISVFLLICCESIKEIFVVRRSFLEVELEIREFENCFKDSGYWDGFILILFDYFFRVYFIYGFLFISEFSIVEKASWLGLGGVLNNLTLFIELTNLFELLLYLLSTILALIFFFLISCSFLALL